MSVIVNVCVNVVRVEGVKVDIMVIIFFGKKVEVQNGDLCMCFGVFGFVIFFVEVEWIRKIFQVVNDFELKFVVMIKVVVLYIFKVFIFYIV